MATNSAYPIGFAIVVMELLLFTASVLAASLQTASENVSCPVTDAMTSSVVHQNCGT
jgi:hypothetical protein